MSADKQEGSPGAQDLERLADDLEAALVAGDLGRAREINAALGRGLEIAGEQPSSVVVDLNRERARRRRRPRRPR